MNSIESARQAMAKRDFAACVEHARAELSQDPMSADALWLAAVAHMELGQFTETRVALSHLLKLLPVAADKSAQLVLLGIACTQLNDLDGGWDAFQRLLETRPDSALAKSILARIAYSRGDRESAQRFAEQFMSGLTTLDMNDQHNRMVEIGKTVYLCSLFATPETAEGWLEGVETFLLRPCYEGPGER